MQLKYASLVALPALVCWAAVLIQESAAFDPVTLTAGGTAYVLTGTQVGVAIASVAGLALAAEALAIAELSRGKRDTESENKADFKLNALFDAVKEVDTQDCAKLMVCHIFTKPTESLDVDEARIAKLFRDVDTVDPSSGYSEYQIAAYVGTFNQTQLCVKKYSRCPVQAEKLEEMIHV